MEILLNIKSNIERNVNLWIVLWLLILLNALTFISLSKGFSVWLGLCFVLLALLGSGILKILAQVAQENEIEIPPQIKANVNEIMQEIKPICDEIFDREISAAIDPIIEELRKDFLKGLTWLWENNEDFINNIEQNLGDIDSIIRLFNSLNEDKYKLTQDLRNSVDIINVTVSQLRRSKEEDFGLLSENINGQRLSLLESMEKEKEIFYDYIYKLLIEQSQTLEDFDPTEHFDTYKLGEQFAGIIEKSLQARLTNFHEKAIEHLEDFSSDVVGRMQKNATRLLNAFRDNQTVLERFENECRGESSLLLRRIDELLEKNLNSQEKANEILLSLAWQDILVEKRWQEIKEKLYVIKDLVHNNVEEDILNYIKEIVDKEIPGISYMIKQAEGAVFYKNLLDAELIYQVYQGKRLNNIINDGVQVLLQFIRPLEMIANRSIRLNEQGLKMRKTMHKRTRAGEFNAAFSRIESLVEADNPQLGSYLDGIFPKGFYSFCNSPYIKKKPDNLNTAAWSLFLGLIDQEDNNDEIYTLAGFLLIAHKLRNRYIHPLKSLPIEIQDESEIDLIRFITYRIINLIIRNEVKGTTSLSFKYK